ncbi:MAG: ABC transporter ATP-binding protein [Nocardioidaceae bacterium]
MTEPVASETGKRAAGVPIVLDGVSKAYPGTEKPAVDSISMEIPAGEIVVLVGPSGCGKTTTMRMINRLIEPTAGKITIGGEDVLSLNDVRLRREVGYVIQQIGLIPHLTIGQNVAMVPKLLKWNKTEINERIDEMLTVVGLPPEKYRSRYPRQLSGGQQQRVGVARALAADPPTMLMDEPFGAVDPITRARLQDEFLDVQRTLRKTIVFVTHDFDEALKIGDRIAVLREGSRIAQYATPKEILARPADDFVEGFIGEGAALKRLRLEHIDMIKMRSVNGNDAPDRVGSEATLHAILDVMVSKGVDQVTIVEADRPIGVVHLDDLLARARGTDAP